MAYYDHHTPQELWSSGKALACISGVYGCGLSIHKQYTEERKIQQDLLRFAEKSYQQAITDKFDHIAATPQSLESLALARKQLLSYKPKMKPYERFGDVMLHGGLGAIFGMAFGFSLGPVTIPIGVAAICTSADMYRHDWQWSKQQGQKVEQWQEELERAEGQAKETGSHVKSQITQTGNEIVNHAAKESSSGSGNKK